MPLQLRYVFTPTPYPIRASVGGANPNYITLHVMVSNPSPFAVAVEEITIQIPVGQESARTLSDSPALPAPLYNTDSGWVASSSGSTVTLTPSPGGLTNSFLFSLPGIQINDTPGVVPLTITELAPPAPKVIDSTTYELIKYEADFPITSFYAQPATLYNLDEPVTLYWTCSEQGQQYAYGVNSDGWQPDDCLNGGTCFTCADGQQGIETPPLVGSTIFALDVIQTNREGNRSIYKTLYTTAQVLLPSVSGASYLEESFSGLIVQLHWLAFNAAYCTVTLDDNVIDASAPTDTYEQGYQVILSGQEGAHQLVVTAHAESGPAQYPFVFPNVYTKQVNIPVGADPYAVAVTPDSSLALVVNSSAGNVTVIDLATLAAKPNPVAVGTYANSIAITPDGALALVTRYLGGVVTVIDLATLTAEPATIPAGISLSAIAITPDGALALVTDFNDDCVAVIDIAGRQTEPRKLGAGTSPAAVAVTPDGALALVVNQNSNDVSVIDIAGRSTRPETIPAGDRPIAVAVTPDGALALVANSDSADVTVIDLATLTVEPATIQVGGSPIAIAITPDGTVAFVADNANNVVTMIDIAGRSVVGQPLPADQGPQDIAVAPNGAGVLTVNNGSNNVTVM